MQMMTLPFGGGTSSASYQFVLCKNRTQGTFVCKASCDLSFQDPVPPEEVFEDFMACDTASTQLNTQAWFQCTSGGVAFCKQGGCAPNANPLYGATGSYDDQSICSEMLPTVYFVCKNTTTNQATCRPYGCIDDAEIKHEPMPNGVNDEEYCNNVANSINSGLYYLCATEEVPGVSSLGCYPGACPEMQEPLEGGFLQFSDCEVHLPPPAEEQSSSVSTTTTDQTTSASTGDFTLCRTNGISHCTSLGQACERPMQLNLTFAQCTILANQANSGEMAAQEVLNAQPAQVACSTVADCYNAMGTTETPSTLVGMNYRLDAGKKVTKFCQRPTCSIVVGEQTYCMFNEPFGRKYCTTSCSPYTEGTPPVVINSIRYQCNSPGF